jgi:cysteinyl-tRNA synthetase
MIKIETLQDIKKELGVILTNGDNLTLWALNGTFFFEIQNEMPVRHQEIETSLESVRRLYDALSPRIKDLRRLKYYPDSDKLRKELSDAGILIEFFGDEIRRR